MTVPKPTINARFMTFHEDNMHVYEGLRRLALEVKRSRKKYGVEGLYDILRYTTGLQTTGSDFKLNDHFTSRYSRMLMQLNAELDGFFELRAIKEPELDYTKLYAADGTPLANRTPPRLTRVEVVYGDGKGVRFTRSYAFDTDLALNVGDVVLVPPSTTATVVALDSTYAGDCERIIRVLERKPAEPNDRPAWFPNRDDDSPPPAEALFG